MAKAPAWDATKLAGNRDDLAPYAPVVHEVRINAGPAAGIESGLAAAKQEWVLFIPVDVPLIPAELLHRWCADALEQGRAGAVASFLTVGTERQPAFCLWKRECLPLVTKTLDTGHRRLNDLLDSVNDIDSGLIWPQAAATFVSPPHSHSQLELWFSNVNTPQELAEAEAWAAAAPDEAYSSPLP